MVENITNRPWGNFEILYDASDVKVKKITINSGQAISYQSHEKRDENWVIVSGEGVLTIDDQKSKVLRGDRIFIKRFQKHRIRCNSKEDLVFIEVQIGEYYGEDDIKRFKDDYSRELN